MSERQYDIDGNTLVPGHRYLMKTCVYDIAHPVKDQEEVLFVNYFDNSEDVPTPTTIESMSDLKEGSYTCEVIGGTGRKIILHGGPFLGRMTWKKGEERVTFDLL